MILKRRADLQARQAFVDGLMNDAKKAQEEAKMYQGERDRAVEKEKEKEAEALKLSVLIANTAHNIKSPTTALGIAIALRIPLSSPLSHDVEQNNRLASLSIYFQLLLTHPFVYY